MDFASVTALADLLKPATEDSDSDEDKPASEFGKMGPGHIGPAPKQEASSEKSAGQKKATKDIWDEEEIPEGAEYETVYDPRPEPEYDIIYKQAVTSEDIYLQMGNKNPTSSSCEDMVIKIKLPNSKMADVELDVKQKFLDCRTPKYKLGLHLPHPVDHNAGKAQWDSNKELLSITLKIMREYDFMNF